MASGVREILAGITTVGDMIAAFDDEDGAVAEVVEKGG
jgi:hypothetical protein